MLLIAHAGHWITSIAYFAPVIGFAGWLIAMRWRERRKGETEQG
jgi:hypothetical protein